MKKLILLFIPLSFLSHAYAPNPLDALGFSEAKTILYEQAYNGEGTTAYCGCSWKGRRLDLSSCDLDNEFSGARAKRAKRLEADHAFPSTKFYKVSGNWRHCVGEARKQGKNIRLHCLATDAHFRKAHNDVTNLFPSVGILNKDKSNSPFVERIGSKDFFQEKVFKALSRFIAVNSKPSTTNSSKPAKKYNKCEVRYNKEGFKPPNYMRGDLARIAAYLDNTYGVSFSNDERKMFKRWNNLDPISISEIVRNQNIIEAQGFGLKLN